MGRGKVVLKRIEDKNNRLVSFSKRRNGLLKKCHELTVLCDVDVAVFFFSDTGKLYEFSTGERMTNILTHYQSFKKEEEELNHVILHEKLASEYSDVCTPDEMTKIIQRHLEENNIKLLDIIGLDKLEQQLDSFLQQVRTRKTQLNMGVVKALQDKKVGLKKERKFMMEEIKAASMNGINDESRNAEQPQLPVMDIQIAW